MQTQNHPQCPETLFANRSYADKATEAPPQRGAVFRPVFNAEAALARVDGNRDLLRPMLRLFAMQWRTLGDEMAKAGRHRDGAALELAAHRLKNSLASFGADQASRVAQDLEERGHQGDFHDVEKTCASLRMEIDRLVNGLKELADEMVPYAS